MATLVLDKYLKKRKISKRRFSMLIGKPYYSVFRYFREGYDPKLSTLTAWASALRCKVRDLIKE